jgi:hypothetical protein
MLAQWNIYPVQCLPREISVALISNDSNIPIAAKPLTYFMGLNPLRNVFNPVNQVVVQDHVPHTDNDRIPADSRQQLLDKGLENLLIGPFFQHITWYTAPDERALPPLFPGLLEF